MPVLLLPLRKLRYSIYTYLRHNSEIQRNTMKRLFAFLPLLVILAACGEQQSTHPAPIAKPTPTVTPPHFYKVGEMVTAGPWEITLRPIKLVDPTTYSQYQEIFPWLKPGDRFLVIDQHLKNISSKTQTVPG